MSNEWFACKQFRVDQDQCAMKVSTDAMILGAWTPLDQANYVADLGCGTGILSLMLAQRSRARITAIELDEAAGFQAARNFANSPWPHLFECVVADAHHHAKLLEGQFDLVICNPPFFEGHVLSNDGRKNAARQLTTLYDRLKWLQSAFTLGKPAAKASFLIPNKDLDIWLKNASEVGWYPKSILHIRGHASAESKRCIIYLSKKVEGLEVTELIVETEQRGNYTEEFTRLLAPFYLHL